MRGGKYLAWLLAVLLFGSLALAGCGDPAKPTNGPAEGVDVYHYVHDVDLGGKKVTCVYEGPSGSYGGGPSCDWNHLH